MLTLRLADAPCNVHYHACISCRSQVRASKQSDLDFFSLQQQVEVGVLVPLPLSLHLLQRLCRCLLLFCIHPFKLPPATATPCHDHLAPTQADHLLGGEGRMGVLGKGQGVGGRPGVTIPFTTLYYSTQWHRYNATVSVWICRVA